MSGHHENRKSFGFSYTLVKRAFVKTKEMKLLIKTEQPGYHGGFPPCEFGTLFSEQDPLSDTIPTFRTEKTRELLKQWPSGS